MAVLGFITMLVGVVLFAACFVLGFKYKATPTLLVISILLTFGGIFMGVGYASSYDSSSSSAIFFGWVLIGIAVIVIFPLIFAIKKDRKRKSEEQEEIIREAEIDLLMENVNSLTIKKVKEIDRYKGEDLSDYCHKMNLLYLKMFANVAGRPIPQRKANMDPAILGGLANGIGGIGAGIYTAIKTEEINYENQRLYNEAVKNNIQSKSEYCKLFKQVEEIYIDIIKIIKETMSTDALFWKNLPKIKDVELIYDYTYMFMKDKDKNICLPARFIFGKADFMRRVAYGMGGAKE